MAFALQKPDLVDLPTSREGVLARYRTLREISRRINDELTRLVSDDAILREARKLGLAHGKTLVLDDMEEMNYVLDLAIHTAAPPRSRAIDRYARSARFAAGSDEALMLDAMQESRFSVLLIDGRHEIAGLVASDLLHGAQKIWLMDVGLESSMPEGAVLATRLYMPGHFAMTAGANVPCDRTLLEDALYELPSRLCDGPLEALSRDRRFAEAVYRIALSEGLMHRVRYRDVPDDA
ncbi:hypothetical protein [Bradyrhizobium sp.]|uniref:hypothetical protein n=1 Tax=Bradyrhizobium sp. TaxID=376 RepID=UPI0040377106